MVVAGASLTVLGGIALLGTVGLRATAQAQCTGVAIGAGMDLDAIINRDPGSTATTFCLEGDATYHVNRTVELGPGDKLVGPPGEIVTRGPASYGVPTAKIRGPVSIDKLIEVRGTSHLSWVEVSGGQIGIAAGQATAASRLEYLSVHSTARTGIGNMRGKLLHSNLYNNGTDREWWGHSAAAVKGVYEYEAAYNYVHDNPGNGLWCDVGCKNEGQAMPNGFWAHDNLLVENGRWGVRYESSPLVRSGRHATGSTALIEGNEIHGNGHQKAEAFGGASMWDAQNATFRNNSFGPETIAGDTYGNNAGQYGRAILFFDSGQKSRTDLWNGKALDNSLGGEKIEGCKKPDRVVRCSGNA